MFPEAGPGSQHSGRLVDIAGYQEFGGGLFGLNNFHFRTDDAGPDPSAFELNFELDPGRPFTAANVTVDSNPTSTGALGTFFGGDDVVGDLDISYVPSSLWLQSNLDPMLCTKGFLPPGFPIPSDVDLDFLVGTTHLFIHARDLAPDFCLGFEVSGAVSTLQLLSKDLVGTPVKSGLVEILFQNTTSGLDGGALFTTPIQEFRLRFDDVPSVEVEWSTTGGSQYFEVDTLVADNLATPFIREDILGGLRMKSSVAAGPAAAPGVRRR